MSAPSYKTHDPKGWRGDPKRGAALGRGRWQSDDKAAAHKIQLCHVELDSGGYDRNGTYFGIGGALYWYATEDGEIDVMLRAISFEQAEEMIRAEYPNAVITRGEAVKIPLCAECETEEVAKDGDVCDKCAYGTCPGCGEAQPEDQSDTDKLCDSCSEEARGVKA